MKNKAIKAGLGYTIGNYLLKGLVFFTIPIFARILTVEEYGLYNTFISYESIISIIIGFAIHTSYKNARYKYKYLIEGAESGYDFQTYVSSTILLIWCNTFIWILVILLSYKILFYIFNLNLINMILLILYSCGSAIILCYNSDASINYKYKNFLKVSMLNSISNIGFSLLFIYTIFNQNRYLGRVIGTVLPVILLAVFISANYFKKAKPKNCWLFYKWGLKYSFPIIPHGISQVILSQFDRIMINNIVGSLEAGVYSFAYNINTIIIVTIQSLDNVWSTWFYEQMKKNNVKSIKRISNIYILCVFLFCLLILFISPELIKILGSEKYNDSIYCVIPIVISGFFSFLYNFPASIEYYFEKTKYIAIGTMTAAIINIILNYIFIRKFGYIAAAYTTLITYILYFLFHYFLSRKILGYYLYSNKLITLLSILMILGGIVCQNLIPILSIRYLITIVILCFGIYVLEVNFKIIPLMKKKIKNRR